MDLTNLTHDKLVQQEFNVFGIKIVRLLKKMDVSQRTGLRGVSDDVFHLEIYMEQSIN